MTMANQVYLAPLSNSLGPPPSSVSAWGEKSTSGPQIHSGMLTSQSSSTLSRKQPFAGNKSSYLSPCGQTYFKVRGVFQSALNS